MFITLKPRDERDASADQIIAPLRPKLARSRARAVHAGGAGRRVGGRPTRTQFQYTLQDADSTS
jgi:HAE1 family hydrophobic/amphiphilic exporter-1